MKNAHTLLATTALAALFSCAGAPAAPFDQLKNANLTAYRLANYEPPAAAPGAPPPAGTSWLPPQIQQWVEQGAAGLQQLLPPGLLPPGMVPQTPAQQAAAIPRFYTFRILSQTQVIDPELKEELADILGDDDNFQPEHAQCSYSELGFSFTSQGGAQPNDLLLSFSCNHVMAQSFAWPHPHSGLKPGTVKDLSEVVNKLWPPGT
jgi:hypothetical protein